MCYSKKNILIFLLSFFAVAYGYAQSPILGKIPLKPVVDIGFLQFSQSPQNYQLDLLASRSFNIALLTSLKLGQSGFSVHTGLGFGSDNYFFKEKWLPNTIDGKLDFFKDNNTERAKISANYWDIPLELRWVSGMGRKVWRITAGAKVGVLFDTHIKIVQSDRTLKVKQDFYLEPFRYGVYGRLGYNWYALYFYYNLSDLFQKNRSPIQPVPFSFGLSLNTF